MSVKLLTEHHWEFLSFKGGCKGSSEFTLVKMPHLWKSHVMAQMQLNSLEVVADPDLFEILYAKKIGTFWNGSFGIYL